MSYRVLAINPGSTSTKIAVYDGDRPVFEKVLRHEPEELAPYPTIIDQYDSRRQLVMEAMRENQVPPSTLHAVVGRGGLVRPVCGGTWKITPQMLEDLKDTSRWGRIHASNLGAFIADAISKELNIPAFIVDPVVVDEFDEIARISGIPEIERSLCSRSQPALHRQALRSGIGQGFSSDQSDRRSHGWRHLRGGHFGRTGGGRQQCPSGDGTFFTAKSWSTADWRPA